MERRGQVTDSAPTNWLVAEVRRLQVKDLERYLALATGLMILASAFVIASEGPALALTNVNVSQQPDNQTEAAIAINPTNPDNIVVVSNASAGGSLFRSVSMDGG